MKILNKLELMSPSIKVGGSNGYVVELPESAGVLLTEESTNGLISTAKTEAISESKSYTDQKVSSVYRVKGTIPSVEDLPENAEVGDVYNISDDLGGHNYVKTEDGWDKLGGTVDLSPYALKTDVSGCVADLEGKITAAQNSAVSTSNAYTDACIVAANLSQYAKAEDVYTKTVADSTFVKVGDDTTGDVDADTVEAEILNVSGCATFSGCTTFSQIPTVNGEELVTVSSCLDYLPAKITCDGNSYYVACCTIIDSAAITSATITSAAFTNVPTVNGEALVKTSCLAGCISLIESYVDQAESDANKYTDDCVAALNIGDYAKKSEVSGCLTALEGCVNAIDAKIPTDYLSVTQCHCGGFDHYIVDSSVKFTETLIYGESEVATINDILPVTKGDQTTPIYSNSNACLEVYGVIANSASFSGGISFSSAQAGCICVETCLSYKGYEVATLNDIFPVTKCTTANTNIYSSSGCLSVCGIIASYACFSGTVEICGDPVATESYVDQAESDANKYTDDCVAAIEAKIPTDYLPASRTDEGCFIIDSNTNPVILKGCVTIGEGLSDGQVGATFNGATLFCGEVYISKEPQSNNEVANKKYVDDNALCAFSESKSYTDGKIASLGSVLEYKGNKTYAELPTEENEVGDVYNITADYAEKGIKAGDNVVWNGSDWDVLSGPIDLSGYYDKEEVDACVKTATDAVSALCSAVDTKLDGKADKSTTYTKTEVDTALEGYLPVENSDGNLKVNEDVVFTACGVRFSSDVYFDDDHVWLKVHETSSLSPVATEHYVDEKINQSSACIQESIDKLSGCVYTKTEVDAALEGYYEVVEGVQLGSSSIVLYKNGATEVSIGSEGNEFWRPVSYKGSSEISEDTHLTPKSYVDNLVSTSISSANTNIVYDEDFVLGDGTFDASTSQMKWTVSPEGATKILSVIALDGEGNLVHPSYKWANNTLTVSIFAESEQDNPGYTVTVSYKK